MALTMLSAETILNFAEKVPTSTGDLIKMNEYLDNEDLEGFERVCRGNHEWFKRIVVPYELTDGEMECWYSNGQLQLKGSHLNGKLHGLCEWWWSNGVRKWLEVYHEGELHGLRESWEEDGSRGVTEMYHNGGLIGQHFPFSN